MVRIRPFLPIALGLLLLTAACGSGGGGSVVTVPAAGDNALLSGTYHAMLFGGTQGGPERVMAQWGSTVADGLGLSQWTIEGNNLGMLMPPSGPEDYGYDIGSDRSLGIIYALPGLPYLRGGVTAAGDLAVAGLALPGPSPLLAFLGRQSGVHDASSLSGTYWFGAYGATVAGPMNHAAWGTFTFDGAGGGSYEETVNQEGAIGGPVNPLLTYSVAPDGGLTIDLGGGFVVVGSITAGGEVLLAAGGTAAGDNPRAYVMVRQGAGLGNADLEGEYFMFGFLHDVASNGYASFTGALVADGMGVNQFVGLLGDDAVVTLQPPEGFLSTVAANGATTITTGGGETLEGGMSSDARFVVCAGSSNAGDNPMLFMLMK